MLICSLAYLNGQASIDPSVIQSTISTLTSRDNSNKQSIEKGVSQVARLWLETDGDEKAFRSFCEDNYIADPDEKYQVFLKISDYLEGISGHFNEMSLRLQKNLQLDNGPLHPIDEKFGSYSPSSHLSDDLYNNKIAFIIALNFPTLPWKKKKHWAPTAKPGPMHVWATCSQNGSLPHCCRQLPTQKAMPTFISPSTTFTWVM